MFEVYILSYVSFLPNIRMNYSLASQGNVGGRTDAGESATSGIGRGVLNLSSLTLTQFIAVMKIKMPIPSLIESKGIFKLIINHGNMLLMRH